MLFFFSMQELRSDGTLTDHAWRDVQMQRNNYLIISCELVGDEWCVVELQLRSCNCIEIQHIWWSVLRLNLNYKCYAFYQYASSSLLICMEQFGWWLLQKYFGYILFCCAHCYDLGALSLTNDSSWITAVSWYVYMIWWLMGISLVYSAAVCFIFFLPVLEFFRCISCFCSIIQKRICCSYLYGHVHISDICHHSDLASVNKINTHNHYFMRTYVRTLYILFKVFLATWSS